jgi:hypothetical protein
MYITTITSFEYYFCATRYTRVRLRVMQTRTREGYGVCGYGYSVESGNPRVTRATP